MAKKPPSSHTIRIMRGEGRYSAIKPVVINIPEPTMAPITKKVESRRFIFRKS
jgi:hypothetical protein